jgi:wyosine [tRNA(Phe)-imidazoG37] synthetase (radical SAM superfamily)
MISGGDAMIAYGPVPSRRLGRSLGVNNVPPKACTYACAYCQVGRTLDLSVVRREFYPPEEILSSVAARVAQVGEAGEAIDYLSFVPDGEPTLDVHLGREIELLRELGRPIAVISNSSLLDRAEVRAELAKADWVSLKVDAVDGAGWRRLNRPHRALDLPAILRGVLEFAQEFPGTLVTETMLVSGANDAAQQVEAAAAYLSALRPSTAYVAVPTRPPARSWVSPPEAEALLRCHRTFEERGLHVEYLMGYEGNAFAATGDTALNLLGITAVHPMREEAVADLLARSQSQWDVVEKLIDEKLLQRVAWRGSVYYLRQPRRPTGGD